MHGLDGLSAATKVPRCGPLEVLADILRPVLAAPPCYIAFSGGRDSSAVLAVATSVARREGLDDPLPVTQLYPGLPETDESEWQEAVVRHLQLKDWARLVVGEENDLLGEPVRASLRERGLLWPPAVHTKVNLLEALSPGYLLTGEGGDEVFGARRPAPWSHLKKGTSVPRGRAVGPALRSALPGVCRYRLALSKWRDADLQPWLRPAVAEEHIRMLAADEVSEPWRWDRALLWLTRRRSAGVLAHNYGLLAAEHGISLRIPLLEPAFLASLGRLGGPVGFPGRTAAMAAVFAPLLPRAVIERKGKAQFNRAFMGRATHEFARDWDGSGVDANMVDPRRLRQEWLSDSPSALSSLLLHAAWVNSDSEGP